MLRRDICARPLCVWRLRRRDLAQSPRRPRRPGPRCVRPVRRRRWRTAATAAGRQAAAAAHRNLKHYVTLHYITLHYITFPRCLHSSPPSPRSRFTARRRDAIARARLHANLRARRRGDFIAKQTCHPRSAPRPADAGGEQRVARPRAPRAAWRVVANGVKRVAAARPQRRWS